jgi:hypothetical protein
MPFKHLSTPRFCRISGTVDMQDVFVNVPACMSVTNTLTRVVTTFDRWEDPSVTLALLSLIFDTFCSFFRYQTIYVLLLPQVSSRTLVFV